MPSKKRYVVANPHGHPAGIPIVQNEERAWYEGDEYEGKPPDWLVEQGYIVEVMDAPKGR